MISAKSFRLIFILCLSVSVLSTSNLSPEIAPGKEKKYFPKALKKLRFGMSFQQVSQIKKGLSDVSDASYNFRKVYNEKVGKGGIDNITYYFNNQGNLPLYEMIVEYESEALRDAAAKKLLGAPNYQEKEWKLDIQEYYDLYAWKHRNKLVFAAPLKGSEWEEGL